MFASPFQSYAYSYPHKSAYRAIEPSIPLRDAWAGEDVSSLFLYVHVPFCEHRCGFCNLFTLPRPGADLPTRYLDAVRRQAEQCAQAVDATFVRFAIGGGTPTYLSTHELETLFSIVSETLGPDLTKIPVGCEASPSTVDAEKLTFLRQAGVDRISLGVQSFDDKEVHAIGRPQRGDDVRRAIEMIRDTGFPTLNLDLIYGGDEQTIDSWRRSVKIVIEYRAEEIYLYPLYVRQLTGLGRLRDRNELTAEQNRQWDQQRLRAYREARDLLIGHGYEQTSLRMFRLPRAAVATEAESNWSDYRCQADGMIGLGCGARSYTKTLHYSYEYAVSTKAVGDVIGAYLAKDDAAFGQVDHGFRLDREDQRRRYLILSLLQCAGLSCEDYRTSFGTDVMKDFPKLDDLRTGGFATIDSQRVKLTEQGIEYSDAIGPWLNSDKVNRLEASYQWR